MRLLAHFPTVLPILVACVAPTNTLLCRSVPDAKRRLFKAPGVVESLITMAAEEASDGKCVNGALGTLCNLSQHPHVRTHLLLFPGLVDMLVRVVHRLSTSSTPDALPNAWALLYALTVTDEAQRLLLRTPGLVQATLCALNSMNQGVCSNAADALGHISEPWESKRPLVSEPGLVDSLVRVSAAQSTCRSNALLALSSLAQLEQTKQEFATNAAFVTMLKRVLGEEHDIVGYLLLVEILASPGAAQVLSTDKELVSIVATRALHASRYPDSLFLIALALLTHMDFGRMTRLAPHVDAADMVHAFFFTLWIDSQISPGDPWRWENALSFFKRAWVAWEEFRGAVVASKANAEWLLKRRLAQGLAYVLVCEREGVESDAFAARFALLSVDVLGILTESGVVAMDDVLLALLATVATIAGSSSSLSLSLSFGAENVAAWKGVEHRVREVLALRSVE